jgi:fumarate reductase flavoprotein subunit
MTTSSDVKDAIVLGFGGGGVAAALALAEGGAKVIAFEKMSVPGGLTNHIEGTYAAESEILLRRNIKATRDEGFRELMNYSHWRADPDLVRTIVDRSGETISWLEQHGVPFAEPTAEWFGGPRVWHLFNRFGSDMIEALVPHAVARGVEIHYETAAKGLLRKGHGPVTGVVVENREGARREVRAKAFIIATGGYADNKEWVRKYSGRTLDENIFCAVPYNKIGEGIQMAWETGAAEEGADVLLLGNPALPGFPPASCVFAACNQPILWTNRNGVRFCDEATLNMVYNGNASLRQPGGVVFTVFDGDTKRYWEEFGCMNVGNYTAPRTRLTKLDEEISEGIQRGRADILVADSIDELANKMGVDKGAFKQTVAEYNGFCTKGHDDRYDKDQRYLRPVKTPKFYAFRCVSQFLGTMGGIKINERTEVLDNNRNVIPGLYAVGNDAGGMYGDSYCVLTPGIASAFAINGGRIGAENALNYIRTAGGRG